MLKNNKIRKELIRMNKDWIFADERNTNIHRDLLPKLIRKVGTEGAMVLITIASNDGAMKEQDLLKSSSDGIEEMRSYVDRVLKAGFIERIGDNVALIEGVFDEVMSE